MEYLNIGGIYTSRLVLGCMRISDKPMRNIERLVHTALDMGINTFDHADIYGGGTCERMYGELIKASPSLRSRMVLQTKCGICGGFYDLSYKHIISSVEGSLSRLNTDRIDILLLHRPDTLMRPEEIARAFDELEKSGKVRVFGVSNFTAPQFDLLQTTVNQKLYFDQLEMSPIHCPMIDSGINAFGKNDGSANDGGGVLEYCRKNKVTIQTYGTMQCSFTDDRGYSYSGAFTTDIARQRYFSLNFCLDGLAQKYETTAESVAVSWVLTHPARMQAIIGTTNDKRLIAYKDCCDVPLTNTEWYKIYEAAGHTIP